MHEIVSFTKDIEFKNMISKITSISLEHTLSVHDDYNVSGDFIISGTYRMTSASAIDNDFSYKVPVDIEIDSKYDLTNLTIDIDDFTYEVLDDDALRVNISIILDHMDLKKEVVKVESEAESDKNDELVHDEDLFLNVPTEKKLEIDSSRKCDGDYAKDLSMKKKEEVAGIDNVPIEDKVDEAFINNSEVSTLIKNEESNNLNTSININNISNNSDVLNNINVEVNNKEEDKKITPLEKEEVSDNSTGTSLFASFDSTNETYSTYSIYIMRDGDTVDEVLSKYHATREELSEYNDLNDLKIGSKVIIPNIKNE